MKARVLALLASSSLASCSARRPVEIAKPPTTTTTDAPSPIRREAISAHIRFLADDLLEGRGTGERGHRIAAAYVANQLQAWGIEPAGDRGTYFQNVPLLGARVKGASFEIVSSPNPMEPLVHERDFVAGADFVTGDYAVEGPAVFVGYGIDCPEYHYDDLHQRDVRGKVAFVLEGAPLTSRPDYFPDLPSAVAGDRHAKIDALAKAGAAGVVFVRTPRSEQIATWARLVDAMSFEHMTRVDEGRPAAGTQLPRFVVPGIVFDHLLAASGRSERLDSIIESGQHGTPQTFDLGIRVKLGVRSPTRSFVSPNVVGRLGADAASLSAGEAVIFSAHLDHLGTGTPVAGDAIYNGAGDDAAGCAVILEIARAFAGSQARPKRSLFFAFFTGEEKGLLGSEYLAMHPPLPLERISAIFQSDFGAYPIFPLRDIEPLGADHNTLDRDVKAAAGDMHVSLWPDSQPMQTRFIRSDHFSFVKRGVPAIYASVGLETASSEEKQQFDEFRRKRYHQPGDEWEPDRDFQPLADYARFMFLVGRSTANRADLARWNPRDFFERFGKRDAR